VQIVVADDEAGIRDLLCDILEPEGAQVRAVSSGLEALAAIEANEPDLAILDVRMPAPDGLAVLQQLRTKGRDLPVLIITAQESSTVTIEAMQRGAYDYIAKPFDPDEVLLVVQRAAEHRRLTREVVTLKQQVPATRATS
jgi:DNA-binding NtrC family response regulator